MRIGEQADAAISGNADLDRRASRADASDDADVISIPDVLSTLGHHVHSATPVFRPARDTSRIGILRSGFAATARKTSVGSADHASQHRGRKTVGWTGYRRANFAYPSSLRLDSLISTDENSTMRRSTVGRPHKRPEEAREPECSRAYGRRATYRSRRTARFGEPSAPVTRFALLLG
ncbi:hypothetical protein [Saccharopolyspora phatthalungensis]|uniref:Uncharacterized protein n=1 Tax=Saccharopolyspora phatthalungensis TaxID=664693 RepID=A0A840QFJ8_9PSEU|nr:hypothetical protein [Saccharopolyspora phatthalungensis]MBB5158700.1 hypothetical protein [Saccharopolyspora phatthalungensis]